MSGCMAYLVELAHTDMMHHVQQKKTRLCFQIIWLPTMERLIDYQYGNISMKRKKRGEKEMAWINMLINGPAIIALLEI